ncbi:hypothetical protein VDGL01_05094 [Verticillium dahliae]
MNSVVLAACPPPHCVDWKERGPPLESLFIVAAVMTGLPPSGMTNSLALQQSTAVIIIYVTASSPEPRFSCRPENG